MRVAMIGLISIPVTLGLPLETALQHVDSAAGTNDCVLTVGSQDVGDRRRSRHQILLIVTTFEWKLRIERHDVGGRIGVDHHDFGAALVVDFNARDGIPARIFHPGLVAPNSLGINDVDETARVVGCDQEH